MAALVQAALFALGAGVLAAMSIAAHSMAYFPIDLGISQAVQAYHPGWLDAATATLSWTGFPPQSDVLFGVIVVVLFALGHRLPQVLVDRSLPAGGEPRAPQLGPRDPAGALLLDAAHETRTSSPRVRSWS
jgi:hypothetical protein